MLCLDTRQVAVLKIVIVSKWLILVFATIIRNTDTALDALFAK